MMTNPSNAERVYERRPIPKVSFNSTSKTFLEGFPTWIKTKKGKNILSLKVSISLGQIIFPLSISLDGKKETLFIEGNKFRISLNGWKVFGHTKREKETYEITSYYLQDIENDSEPKYEKPKLELVKNFIEFHSPFTQKYRKGQEVQGLYGKQIEWIHKERRLNTDDIIKARLGKSLISYFSTLSPDVIGIDLDFHAVDNAWIGEGLTNTLQTYEDLISSIGLFPSFVYKSPRSIHLYFKFSFKAPFELIAGRLKAIVSPEIGIEVLPSPTQSVRIDSVFSFLDPRTLELIPEPKIEEIRTYSVSEYFGLEEIKEWKKPNKRRERSLALRKIASIETLEEKVLPITKSNQIFLDCPLLPAYYKSGMSVGEAYERINLLLLRSNYTGELLNGKRLSLRLESAWRNFTKKGYSFTGIQKDRQLELRDFSYINTLAANSPFPRRREMIVKEFLENLIGWIRYHENMNLAEKELWAFYYTYRDDRNRISGFRVFRKKGWIPIPSVMLVKWYSRYKTILKWLEEKKILTPMTGYSVEKSQCRYFEFRELYEIKKNPYLDFIEELRRSELTQAELALILGLKQYHVSRLLSGTIDLDKMIRKGCFNDICKKWETYIETMYSKKA